MKLKYKIILPTLILFILFSCSFFILTNNYKNDIETINNNRGIEFHQILKGLINLKTQPIVSYIEDNSYWDEMVEFVKSPNQKWIEDTILPSYSNFGIDYLLIFNKNGEIASEIKADESCKNLSKTIFDLKILDNNKSFSKSFFIKFDEKIIFLHVTTIHYTEDSKKVKIPEGFLVGAKIIDENFISTLVSISSHSIEVAKNSKSYDLLYPLKNQDDETIENFGIEMNSALANVVLDVFNSQLSFVVVVGVLLSLIFLLSIHFFIIVPFIKIANSLKRKNVNEIDGYLGDSAEIGEISRLILDAFKREDQIEQLLITDVLTGLGNRNKLLKHIDEISNPALALLDIYHFGDINDFYGVEIGDMVIKEFARKVTSILDGKYTCYRLGADQFVILAENTDNFIFELEIEKIKSYLVGQHITLLNKEIQIQLTVCISFENKDDILQSAHLGLNFAKKTKKHFVVYGKNLGLEEECKNNLEWSLKLKKAILEDRIILFYQPIYNNTSNEIEKYECLVRMIDEDGTIISPNKFLDIAKKSNQYIPITKIVVAKAFEKFSSLKHEFSINITLEDILSDDFRFFLDGMAKKYDLRNQAVFELVESEGIENFEDVSEFISIIKGYGYKIAIDDFGTGYSNFEYLLKLNSDFIKIDGSIIKDIDKNPDAEEIVKIIIDFAKMKNLKVIAEYVCTKEVSDKINSLGIDFSQGYFIGQPEVELRN